MSTLMPSKTSAFAAKKGSAAMLVMAAALAFVLAIVLAWYLGNQHGLSRAEPAVVANEVDIGFAQSMLVHHSQAIQMSMLVKESHSAQVRGLAQSILLNQTHESGLLKGWLTAWNAPVLVAGPAMAWVENAKNLRSLEDIQYASLCKASGGVMPGMATPEQLEQLRVLKGEAQSRLFYTLMTAHHRSALQMAGFAMRNGQTSLIKNFAYAVVKDQTSEITWMESRLKSGEPL